MPKLIEILRVKGERTCSVCKERRHGALVVPDGRYICFGCSVPVLEGLILTANRGIGIIDEDEPQKNRASS